MRAGTARVHVRSSVLRGGVGSNASAFLRQERPAPNDPLRSCTRWDPTCGSGCRASLAGCSSLATRRHKTVVASSAVLGREQWCVQPSNAASMAGSPIGHLNHRLKGALAVAGPRRVIVAASMRRVICHDGAVYAQVDQRDHPTALGTPPSLSNGVDERSQRRSHLPLRGETEVESRELWGPRLQ